MGEGRASLLRLIPRPRRWTVEQLADQMREGVDSLTWWEKRSFYGHAGQTSQRDLLRAYYRKGE